MGSRQVALAGLASLAFFACSKDDEGPPSSPPPLRSAAATVLPASPADSASSPPSAAVAFSAPPAVASAWAATSPPTCGDKPLPPCPLHAWMKANTAPAMRAQDFDALKAALDEVATFAPPGTGYPNWVSISKDGADAARVQDLDAVKAACRGCHNQYKDKYKREMRGRPI